MRSHSGSVTRTFMACPPRVLEMVLQRTKVQPTCQCFIFSERCKTRIHWGIFNNCKAPIALPRAPTLGLRAGSESDFILNQFPKGETSCRSLPGCETEFR